MCSNFSLKNPSTLLGGTGGALIGHGGHLGDTGWAQGALGKGQRALGIGWGGGEDVS